MSGVAPIMGKCPICKASFRARNRKGRIIKMCSEECRAEARRPVRKDAPPPTVRGCKWLPVGASAWTLVDADTYAWAKDYAWSLHMCGYAVRSSGVYMHREILGITDKGHRVLADHINHDRLDNRTANLRQVTCAQNTANRRVPGTGIKSVYHSRAGSRYAVTYKRAHIGTYATRGEAILARDKAARAAHPMHATVTSSDLTHTPMRIIRKEPKPRAQCSKCKAVLGAHAMSPSTVAARRGKPPLCIRCQCIYMNDVRYNHPPP